LLRTYQDEIVKFLDKATNGNYSIISNGEDKPLNAPPEIKPQSEPENPDLGHAQRSSVDVSRLNLLTEQVKSSVDQNNSNFVVVNNSEIESKGSSEQANLTSYEQKRQFFMNGDIKAYKEATGESTFSIATDVFVNINDACQKAKDFAKNYLEDASVTMQNFLLNSISYSQSAMKVANKTVDITKFNLNLSVTTEKTLENMNKHKV
jgi:hypothetical protein